MDAPHDPPSSPLSRTLLPALVVLLLVAPALAGCVGSTGDGGTGGPAGGGDGPGDGAGTDGADGGSGADGAGGDGGGADGGAGDDGKDGAGGNGTGGDGDAGPRTPADAMEPDPVETGEGWARFTVTGTADFAAQVDVFDVHQDAHPFNLTLVGDEVAVEAVLTWGSDIVDLDLLVKNDAGDAVQWSGHPMAALNALDPVVAFNGTRWEQILLNETSLGEGTWAVVAQEVYTLEPDGVVSGFPFTVDVWVWTVPPTETHVPGA